MAYKLLLIGKNAPIIDIFFNQLTDDFDCMTSSCRPGDLKKHMEMLKPVAICYCLYNETQEDFLRITELQNQFAYMNTPLIIIGEKEDCDEFQNATMSSAQLELNKPITSARISRLIGDFLNSNSRSGKSVSAAPKASSSVSSEEDEYERMKRLLADIDDDSSSDSDFDQMMQFMTEIKSEPSVISQRSEEDILEQARKITDRQLVIDSHVNAAAEMPPVTPSAEADSGKKHILVIDDDPLMLKVMKDYLHNRYEVATAKGGKIAYKFLEKKHTDLILLDYEMPEENGPAVYRKIREMPGYKDIPIFFLTGVADKARIMEVAQLKPQGYLLKPVEYDMLMSMVTQVLG